MGQGLANYDIGKIAASHFLWNHIYFQTSACLVVCVSLSEQGGQFIFSTQEFAWPVGMFFAKRLEKSLFFGAGVGFNSATPAEAVRSNRWAGAGAGNG